MNLVEAINTDGNVVIFDLHRIIQITKQKSHYGDSCRVDLEDRHFMILPVENYDLLRQALADLP